MPNEGSPLEYYVNLAFKSGLSEDDINELGPIARSVELIGAQNPNNYFHDASGKIISPKVFTDIGYCSKERNKVVLRFQVNGNLRYTDIINNAIEVKSILHLKDFPANSYELMILIRKIVETNDGLMCTLPNGEEIQLPNSWDGFAIIFNKQKIIQPIGAENRELFKTSPPIFTKGSDYKPVIKWMIQEYVNA